MKKLGSKINTKDDHQGSDATIFMIVVIVIYLFWIISPNPNPCFPEFRVTYASVTSNTNSTTCWNVKFLVHNHNKDILIIYEDFKVSFYHQSSQLTDTTMPNFSQDAMSQTTLNGTFPGTKDSSHVSRVVEEEVATNGGRLKLNLRMLGKIGFKSSKLESSLIWSNIVCENLVFQVSDVANISATLLGGTYGCYVEKFVI